MSEPTPGQFPSPQPPEPAAGTSRARRGLSFLLGPEKFAQLRAMGDYFALHDFLVGADGSLDPARRKGSAYLLVGPGTAAAQVVRNCLDWIERNNFFCTLTWHTPSELVLDSLVYWKQRITTADLCPAAQSYLFPGEMDLDVESVLSKDAVRYALEIERSFDYTLLSAYGFNLQTGRTCYYYEREVALQRALASLPSRRKYLFLDPDKFDRPGQGGYGLAELLGSCQMLSIYTVQSDRSAALIARFAELAARTLDLLKPGENASAPDVRTLRLVLAGDGEAPTVPIYAGRLRSS
jgi:hypothetical protein